MTNRTMLLAHAIDLRADATDAALRDTRDHFPNIDDDAFEKAVQYIWANPEQFE